MTNKQANESLIMQGFDSMLQYFIMLVPLLYFLIPANIAKIFNPITDFVISIATDKANVFIETQPVTVETKMFLSV